MWRWQVMIGLVLVLGVAGVWAEEPAAPAPAPPPAAANKPPAVPTTAQFIAEGDQLLKAKDYSKALSKYLMAWLQGPENITVLGRIGNLFYVSGKYIDATHFFALAIKLDEKAEEPVIGLANSYIKAKVPDQAVILLEDLNRQRQFAKSPRFHLVLGITYIKVRKFDKAIASLKTAITLAPDQGTLYGELGNAYYGAGKYQDAAEAYAKAAEKDPKDAIANLNRSMALEKLEKYPEAIAALQQYLELAKPAADDPQRKRLDALKAKLPK